MSGRPGPIRSLLATAVAGQLRFAARLSEVVWEPAVHGLAEAARRGRSGAVGPGGSGAGRPGGRPGVVRLHARRGADVTVAFAVENRHDHAVDVTFAADPAPPLGAVTFDPPSAVLPPGGEVVVRAVVPVPDHVAAGVYATALHVRNLPAAPVPVEIVVG